MRVLAIADLHGSHDVCKWFVRRAGELAVDAIVLAGDILGFSDEVEDPEQDQKIDADCLERDLLDADVPVLYILGNDDLIEFRPPHENFVPLHNCRIDMGRFNFVGYRYSLPWMGGIGEKPEDEILDDLESLAAYLDSGTVLVTHSPAHGILDPGFGTKKIGSRSLKKLIEDHPIRAHVHGHSHGGFGRDGVHFSVASALHRRSILIDLETLEHEVITG
jgi:Icc-related predicted phosphoesterase